ncbi:MAG: acetylglutamate kinase [Candidatus Omnitrophica bacterium]|nr:acetylglutamate kinase [Candidatus Omnitrophota bacterium]
MENIIKKAGVLVEAIPYIDQYRRKVFVIKYGGSILHDDVIRKRVLEDIVFLSFVGIRIILVHGGGPNISNRLKEMGIEPQFHNGIRVTDEMTLQVVIKELDEINDQIVAEIKALKGDVTGLSGHENIVHVEKKKADLDLGYVGTITNIEFKLLAKHLRQGRITVVAPLGISIDQQPHNVNADEVASAIAASMRAEKFVLLTNVPGVMRDPLDPSSLYSTLTVAEVDELKKQGIISGGMIPKVDSCIEALAGGIPKAHIIDARQDRALLLEIFTDTGVGTQIVHG